MSETSDQTVERLNAWYAGDADALGALLQAELGWIRARVRKEAGGAYRERFDSMDLVQAGVVKLLRSGPRYAPCNRAQFRALLAKVVVSAVRDELDRARAVKRDVRREERLPSRGLSRAAPLGRSITMPDEAAARAERRERVRAVLDQLPAADRELIRLRQVEGASFAEIARALELDSPEAARMRFNRALPRLARRLEGLRGEDRAAGEADDSPS